MTDIEPKPFKARPKFRLARNILIGLAGLILLLAVAWFFLEQYVQIETYRPMLEAKIEDAAGLPASIGELDLAFAPLPVIRADGITVGEGNFRLQAERAELWPDLGELLHREVRVTRIDLARLAVVVPSDPAELKQRFRAIAERMSRKRGGRIRFNVDRIQAQRATLYLDEVGTPLFTGDIDVRDVLSPTPAARIDAAVVALRDEVKAGGDIHVQRGPRGKGIESFGGSFSIDGLHLAKVVENVKAPRVVIDVDGRFSGKETRSLSIGLSGKVEPAEDAKALGESLEGPFAAKAVWDGSNLRLENIEWEADGLDIAAADVVRTEEGLYGISIPAAAVGRLTLDPLFARIPGKSLRLEPGRSAVLKLEGFKAGFAPKHTPNLQEGRVTLSGISVLNEQGKPLFQDVQGVATLDDNIIRIEELEGGGVGVVGTVTPDFEARRAAIDLSGGVALSRAALAPFIPVERIRDLKGTVKLNRIAGTFGGGGGLPEDFVIEGATEDARLALQTEQFTDVFAPIAATFTTQGKAVEMTVKATSEKMGPAEAAGRYVIEDRTWKGTFTTDLQRTVTPFLTKESMRKVVPALLAPYGVSTFDVTATFPAGKRRDMAFRLERQGDPALNAELALLGKEGGGFRLGDLQGTAAIPLATSDAYLPQSVQAEGTAGLVFRRSAQQKTFEAQIDLAQASVAAGEYIRKRGGEPATAVVAGEASDDRWGAQTLVVSVAGETARGVWRENRLVFPELNLDAGRLSALLREGTQATGAVQGTAAFNPTQADVLLRNVALTYRPGVSVESLNGRVVYTAERLAFDNLTVRGANSVATVSLARENGAWRGDVNAAQLDINAITELQRAARTREEAPAQPAAGAKAEGGGFHGRVDVRAEQLIYRKAVFNDVRASVIGEGNRITVPSLSLRPEQGVATAEVVVARENAGAPWVVVGKADLDGIGASILDGLVFKEPRGLTGQVSGQLAFRIPMLPDTPPVNAASGEAVLKAKDGSFGRMGIATKILNVMRTAEIFRLRMPSIQDEGLTYDTAEFTGKMTEGVLRIDDFALERPSFGLAAEGIVNFPKDEMRVEVNVFPFQTVTGLAERVPIIGRAVSELKKLTPLGIVAQGSPFDPTVMPGAVVPGAQAATPEEAQAGEETAEAEAPAEPEATAETEAPPAAESEAPAETAAQEPAMDQPPADVAQTDPPAEPPADEAQAAPEEKDEGPRIGRNARRIVRDILGR